MNSVKNQVVFVFEWNGTYLSGGPQLRCGRVVGVLFWDSGVSGASDRGVALSVLEPSVLPVESSESYSLDVVVMLQLRSHLLAPSPSVADLSVLFDLALLSPELVDEWSDSSVVWLGDALPLVWASLVEPRVGSPSAGLLTSPALIASLSVTLVFDSKFVLL